MLPSCGSDTAVSVCLGYIAEGTQSERSSVAMRAFCDCALPPPGLSCKILARQTWPASRSTGPGVIGRSRMSPTIRWREHQINEDGIVDCLVRNPYLSDKTWSQTLAAIVDEAMAARSLEANGLFRILCPDCRSQFFQHLCPLRWGHKVLLIQAINEFGCTEPTRLRWRRPEQ